MTTLQQEAIGNAALIILVATIVIVHIGATDWLDGRYPRRRSR